MTTRTMKGPEPLYRLKVCRLKAVANPLYTGYGCGEPAYVPSSEVITTFFGPYTRRHAAVSMRGTMDGPSEFLVFADIETCTPEWKTEA